MGVQKVSFVFFIVSRFYRVLYVFFVSKWHVCSKLLTDNYGPQPEIGCWLCHKGRLGSGEGLPFGRAVGYGIVNFVDHGIWDKEEWEPLNKHRYLKKLWISVTKPRSKKLRLRDEILLAKKWH